MADAVFDIGDVAVLTHAVAVDGIATDPSTIRVRIKDPTGEVVADAEYAGGAGQVLKTAIGTYVYQLQLVAGEAVPGRYRYRWETTGVGQEAEEGSFRVRRSQFV